MATMFSAIYSRADELRKVPGMTPLRIIWRLRKEFPVAERDMLVVAAKIEGHPRGINPRWTEHGQALRPTQIRFQPKRRGAPPDYEPQRRPWKGVNNEMLDYPTISIPAKEIVNGDWIEDVGPVEWTSFFNKNTRVQVVLNESDAVFYNADESVKVRLEDKGQSS